MELKRVKTADVYPSEGNPREDMGDLDALAASLELNPTRPGEPLNPPLVVQDGGVYRIVDGERRWRAMRQAGTVEFDAVVCEDWEDADAALAMLATDDKKPLDEVERSRGVQRALLLGVEPQKVEKAARRKGLRRVKRAAERLGAEAELMSLDHLAAVDKLAEEHPELADEVAGASEGTWERVYRDALDRVKKDETYAALLGQAEALGIELAPEDERPDGLCYEATCRTPEELAEAFGERGGAATYVPFEAGAYTVPRVAVFVPSQDDDPARQAALEARDAMAAAIADMLHSARAHLVPKVMGWDPSGASESMAAAVELYLGDAEDQWSPRGKAMRWLDEAEWEGSRPDGSPTGLVAAAMLRQWMDDSEPSLTIVGMACGVDPMSGYGRERICALLDCLGAATADGWQPNTGDMALMAELSAACKETESEEEE